MSCSCADVAFYAFLFVTAISFCLFVFVSVWSVCNGDLDVLTHGKDFEKSPCGFKQGKQHFEMRIPYKPKSYHLNKLNSKLLDFSKLPKLSVCVSECPYRENATDLLVESGYRRLFDSEGGFVCGEVPDYIGLYQLEEGRCNPAGTLEDRFSAGETAFHNENVVCCFV